MKLLQAAGMIDPIVRLAHRSTAPSGCSGQVPDGLGEAGDTLLGSGRGRLGRLPDALQAHWVARLACSRRHGTVGQPAPAARRHIGRRGSSPGEDEPGWIQDSANGPRPGRLGWDDQAVSSARLVSQGD
jgi:hypothetical protein